MLLTASRAWRRDRAAAASSRMPPVVIGPLFADCAGDRDLRAAFMTTLCHLHGAGVGLIGWPAGDTGLGLVNET